MIPKGLKSFIASLESHGSAEAAIRARALYEAVVEERLRIARYSYEAVCTGYMHEHTLESLDRLSVQVKAAEKELDDARRIYWATFHNPVPYPKYAGD